MRSAGTRGARTSASWRMQYGDVQRGEKAALILLLFLFWLVLNGKVTLDIVLTGAAASAALSWFAHRVLGISPRAEVRVLRRLPGVLSYLCYLVGQVICANLAVIRLILCPGTGRAKLVWFAPPIQGGLARLALANSITLTPGTVTVSLGEDVLCVYALRPELAEGLAQCGFVTRLRRLEGGEDHG